MLGKKGVELSMNIIIIAALCLIVLIIILFIFKNQIGAVAQEFMSIFTGAKNEGGNNLWGMPGQENSAKSTDSSTGAKSGGT